MVSIATRERRHAAQNAWGPATAIWVYMLSKGVKDVKPSQFNPFIDESNEDETRTKSASLGRRLSWMSKETAQGIVEASEKKLLPAQFWLQIAVYWYDILATADM